MTLSRLRHDLEGKRLACSFEETSQVVASLNHEFDLSETARTQQALLAMLTDVAFRMAHLEPGLPDLARIIDAIAKLSSMLNARERLALQTARAAGPRGASAIPGAASLPLPEAASSPERPELNSGANDAGK